MKEIEKTEQTMAAPVQETVNVDMEILKAQEQVGYWRGVLDTWLRVRALMTPPAPAGGNGHAPSPTR